MKVTVELEAWVVEMLLRAKMQDKGLVTIEGRLAYWAEELADRVWEDKAIAQDKIADSSEFNILDEPPPIVTDDDDIPF